jgi:protease IV
MNPISRAAVCLFFASMTVSTGCSPVTFSFTLFADNSKLEEATVRHDKNAGEAKVLIIDIRGLISDREGGDLFGTGPNPVDELTAKLVKAETEPAIKGVILRISSPGGTVSASDMMYREIRGFAARSGKPVVASLGEIAASGGYYVALAADRIVAEPTCIAGSVGVIIPTVNVSEGLNRIGIRSRSVTSRPNKDIANPLEPIREEHYAILQALVDEFYAAFRVLVIERRGPSRLVRGAGLAPVRPLDMSRLDELTDGRVVTGMKAVDAGLADEAGGIDAAFQTAKALAGLSAARLVKYYRQSAEIPRTVYASAGQPARSAEAEINVLQLRLGSGGLSTAGQAGGAYYLWLPPTD